MFGRVYAAYRKPEDEGGSFLHSTIKLGGSRFRDPSRATPSYHSPRNQEAQRALSNSKKERGRRSRRAEPTKDRRKQLTMEVVLPKNMAVFLLLLATTTLQPCRCQVTATPGVGGGEWRLLRESIGLSAMHMQLLRNDRVAMFDRTDFGRSNLSLPGGRCRHDLLDSVLKDDCTAHSLLYDLSSNSVLPLTIFTDTWCSSGAVLPDGTLLQSGGYNDGDRVVRSLSPCSSCDWVEHPGYLAVRRWYATDQILPDGRVFILGGRKQYSYEFFPREEAAAYPREFAFLKETRDGEAENNLYPFVHLLPDGTLFVFANTRAVALDYATGRVVRAFPPVPDGQPRNYPSSGSSVLLPLRLPTDGSDRVDAEVLVCGGAPRVSYQLALNGTFLPALITCARLAVTDPEGTWRMEAMPMARVMGDMLLLPTGDVLVVNGAGRGTAGWELGRDPVTAPVLYRPYDLPGRRFTTLNPSGIPRMYHSSAVVDTHGRVLVGGSNPHVYYNFTGVEYPTELRLEAFHPPYLSRVLDGYRPEVVGVAPPGGTVAYGQTLVVTFEVGTYRPQWGVAVALLAPSFTTHAFAMNQRMVVLAVADVKRPAEAAAGRSTYRATAAAPPTPRVAPPGYYLLFVVHAGVPSKGVWVKIH
uniref:Galactose oxidase n=1 Tax=Anthurium amnicola TaxID=1678845 RepID=A0A1D1XPE5_9ARAE